MSCVLYMFDVMCVIHVVVNNNLFVVCIQDSQKTPTPSDTQSDETTISSDTDALIEALLAARKEAFSKAEENITAVQKKQKEEYDRKHHPKVLFEDTKQKQLKGRKPLWLKPYNINIIMYITIVLFTVAYNYRIFWHTGLQESSSSL